MLFSLLGGIGKMKVMTLSSSLLYFFTCLPLVSCEHVSSATFSSLAQTDGGYGRWTVTATCGLKFPGRTIAVGECYVFNQFSVNITSYSDTLPGTVVKQDPRDRWVVTTCSTGATSSLGVSVSFDYTEYLGSADPKGICELFTDQAEAEQYAITAPILTNPHADPFITTTVLGVQSMWSITPGTINVVAGCNFNHDYIELGSNQAYILIVFPDAVNNFKDEVGGHPIVYSQDNMVYILRYKFASSDWFWFECSYTINSDDELFNKIDTTASLYASYEVAYTAAVSPVPATTASTGPSIASVLPVSTTTDPSIATMPQVESSSASVVSETTIAPSASTTTDPSIATMSPVQSTSTSAVSETTVAPSASTTAGGQTNSESPTVASYVESGDRNKLKEVDFLRDTLTIGSYHIWNKSSHNILHCGRVCLADAQCMSVFYNSANKTCAGHKVVYGNVNGAVDNVRYFYVV